MAGKPTSPAAGPAPGLFITRYSTDLSQACLPKEEAAIGEKKDIKPKKGKKSSPCIESFYYHIEYPNPKIKPPKFDKDPKGSFEMGPDGKIKSVSLPNEAQKYLSQAKEVELAKLFGDVASYVAAWQKPIGTIPALEAGDKRTSKTKKAEVLSGATLGIEVSDKVINFIVLGPASPKDKREIAVELMQLEKRELLLDVLENLKSQAGKINTPDHLTQKERVESLIIQTTLAIKAEEILTKDTKLTKEDPILLARSIVATTISGLSPNTKEPLDFLKSKFDDFAKANSKGVTIIVNRNPHTEVTIDPYQFLSERLLKLKTEPGYQNTKSNNLLDQAISLLNKAIKEKRINYITKSATEAFVASLKDQIPITLDSLVKEELQRAAPDFNENSWKLWLEKKPSKLSNFENVFEKILEGFKGVTEGKVKVDLRDIDFAVRNFTLQQTPNMLENLVNQKNLYLAAIGITRALLGHESSPKKTLKVWVTAKNDFEELPIDFGESDKKTKGLAGLLSSWNSAFLVPTQNASKKDSQPMGPPAPVSGPKVVLPPSNATLPPTAFTSTPSVKATSTIHWSAFAIEAASVVTGSVLLAAANDSSASPDQGVLGVGNPTLTHSGGAVLGFGLGGLAGRGTSLLIGRLQPNKPWTPARSLLPDIAGAIVGGVLGGLIPLATRSAVENATGGGNTGRNPGMEYGALVTVPLP